MYRDPCYIFRKRLDGTLKAIENIIQNIEETDFIPAPIIDIVKGGTIDLPDETEESLEERLASVGGESSEILLSKEANKEQLEIAKRIEKYNAVLVQGPPGTGKTHTIANLMGHFLSQGKSILVTSQTTKALSVLKEKVVPSLQNLCVSVLEDTNEDMEKAVDGITEYMSKTTSHELKNEMQIYSEQRKEIISKLALIRRKIFDIISKEGKSIIYNGEEISPSDVAKFILENEQTLGYIPGKVKSYTALPLTAQELVELYRSNEYISNEIEEELSKNLPETDSIISPEKFKNILDEISQKEEHIENLINGFKWNIKNLKDKSRIEFVNENIKFLLKYPDIKDVQALKEMTQSFGKIEDWMKRAAVDGKKVEHLASVGIY